MIRFGCDFTGRSFLRFLLSANKSDDQIEWEEADKDFCNKVSLFKCLLKSLAWYLVALIGVKYHKCQMMKLSDSNIFVYHYFNALKAYQFQRK